MQTVNKHLWASVGAALAFVLVLLWYTCDLPYLGPVFIGVVAGIVAVAELALLVLSIKDFKVYGFHGKTVLLMLISGMATLSVGYFFVLWAFLKFAGVW